MLPHGCANTLTDLRGLQALAAAVVDLQRIERCSGVSRHAGLHTVETNLGPIPEDDCVSGVNVVPQAINPAPPRPIVSGGLNLLTGAIFPLLGRVCCATLGAPTPIIVIRIVGTMYLTVPHIVPRLL